MRIKLLNFLGLLVMLLFVTSACRSPVTNLVQDGGGDGIQSPRKSAALNARERKQLLSAFQLDVGDVVDISVFGEKNLKGTFQVYPDCTIQFPLIKKVKVCGRTPGQIRTTIATKLHKDYLQRYPSVGVKVIAFNSKKIHVFGQVQKPGRFDYYPGLTMIQAIAIAGGFTPKASRNDTRLIRKVNGVKRRFRIPLGNLNSKRVVDFAIRPGDIIFIPEGWF